MAKLSQYTKGVGGFYAHNCYLQIWAETGIFALLSFIVFIILILRQGIKTFIKTHDYIVLGLLCAIFGFLVHSFFDNHLYSLQLAVLFWFLAGMLAAVNKTQEMKK
jgi:O-antigen ligase